MAEIIVVKLRVKTKVMALLTPGQRVIVEQQLRLEEEERCSVDLLDVQLDHAASFASADIF